MPRYQDDEELDPTTPPVDDTETPDAMPVDPSAAPAPEAQDPMLQNVSMAMKDPAHFDAKNLLMAKLQQAIQEQQSAKGMSGNDQKLRELEAKQMLQNRLADRAQQLGQAFTPTKYHMADNSTAQLGQSIGQDQSMRAKLRSDLMAKAGAGQNQALSGLVGLQGKEMTLKSADARYKDQMANTNSNLDKTLANKTQNAKLMAGNKADENAAKANKEKILPSGEAAAVADLDSARNNLKDLANSWDKLAAGKGASLKQYVKGTDANKFSDNRKAAAQVIGYALEGGKLTDADVARYENMLPGPTDNKATKDNKVAQIDSMLATKQKGRLSTLAAAGYNTGNIQITPSETPKKEKEPKLEDTALADQQETDPKYKGPTITQKGHTFKWNPTTKDYE